LCLALPLLSCIKVDPTITLSTKTLDFGDDAVRLTVVVQNSSHDKTLTSGVVPLEFAFSRDQPWIRVEPKSGECGEGESSSHDVIVDRSLLELGDNLGLITVYSNGGNRSISVRAHRAVSVCDLPPSMPQNPTPLNGGVGVSVGATLIWSDGSSSCPGLTATYDVYFGTTSPPPLDHNNAAARTWDPGTLQHETTYYWRIVAKDGNGSTSSAEWSFTTEAAPCVMPPSAVALTAPANGATGESNQQDHT
jgi:hypothetical protein